PKARTVADVLEMKGEPVNISNIEKQFRQGISHSYQTLKTNGKSAADIIRKIIGITLIVFGAICAFASFFVPVAFNIERESLFDTAVHFNETTLGLPFWVLNLSLFLVSCLPFIFLILLGIKVLNPKTKHIGLVSIILGFLWLTAMFVFTYEMINSDTGHRKLKQSIKKSFDITISKSDLMLDDRDTLHLFLDRDPRIFSINDTVTCGHKYNEINDVEVKVLESMTGKPYIEIEEKTFNQSSYFKAEVKLLGKRNVTINNIPFSNTLNYNYSIKNDTLALSNAILATLNDYTKESEVKVKIFITPEQTIKINGRDEEYIENIDLEPGTNYYRFNKGKLKYINNDIIN